jgi:hypothetical protein
VGERDTPEVGVVIFVADDEDCVRFFVRGGEKRRINCICW